MFVIFCLALIVSCRERQIRPSCRLPKQCHIWRQNWTETINPNSTTGRCAQNAKFRSACRTSHTLRNSKKLTSSNQPTNKQNEKQSSATTKVHQRNHHASPNQHYDYYRISPSQDCQVWRWTGHHVSCSKAKGSTTKEMGSRQGAQDIDQVEMVVCFRSWHLQEKICIGASRIDL